MPASRKPKIAQRREPEPAAASEASAVDAFDYYPQLQRVKLFVEANLWRPLTRREVAEVAGHDERYFSCFFHEKTGMRFRDWLSSLRIEGAKRMMRSRTHTISEVAFEVGFRDLRTFERAFKRRTSQTPREYRRSAEPRT
jgi:transcriptional regulator GlxA family with amidase domain